MRLGFVVGEGCVLAIGFLMVVSLQILQLQKNHGRSNCFRVAVCWSALKEVILQLQNVSDVCSGRCPRVCPALQLVDVEILRPQNTNFSVVERNLFLWGALAQIGLYILQKILKASVSFWRLVLALVGLKILQLQNIGGAWG